MVGSLSRQARVLCALAALAGAGAADARAAGWGAIPGDAPGRATQRVTGGQQISITEAAWQVRLRLDDDGVCGGAILDATHIVTAGHCTYGLPPTNGDVPLLPSEIDVVSGSSSFTPVSGTPPDGGPPDNAVISSVVGIRRHPAYVPSADGLTNAEMGVADVAVLQLATPLTLDGVVRRAIALPDRNSEIAVGTTLSVTGFGQQNEFLSPDGKLYRLSNMGSLDPVEYTADWNALYVTTTSPNGLFCSGDSGGPLVRGSGSSAVLIGIVSFSPSCDANDPAVYTNVAAGAIRDFITGSNSPPAAPIGGSDVLMTADGTSPTLTPGRVLSCSPGTWSGGPEFTVRFSDASGAVLQEGTARTYAITAADLDRRIRCRATARNEGGVGLTPPTVLTPAVTTPQQTTTTPPMTPPMNRPATGPSSSMAEISAALIVDRQRLGRGGKLRLTMRLGNRSTVEMKRPRACLKLPSGWQVVGRPAVTRSGRTVCTSQASLPAGGSLRATVTVRVGGRSRRGLQRLTLTTSADNAEKASAGRSVRVR